MRVQYQNDRMVYMTNNRRKNYAPCENKILVCIRSTNRVFTTHVYCKESFDLSLESTTSLFYENVSLLFRAYIYRHA